MARGAPALEWAKTTKQGASMPEQQKTTNGTPIGTIVALLAAGAGAITGHYIEAAFCLWLALL